MGRGRESCSDGTEAGRDLAKPDPKYFHLPSQGYRALPTAGALQLLGCRDVCEAPVPPFLLSSPVTRVM